MINTNILSEALRKSEQLSKESNTEEIIDILTKEELSTMLVTVVDNSSF